MKRILAIFLFGLYLSSFAGMLWAQDCVQQSLLTYEHTADNKACYHIKGHSQNTTSHPLLQFCRMLEVHKEVIVKHVNSTVKHFFNEPSSNYQSYITHTEVGTVTSSFHHLYSHNKYYLLNCVFLI